MPNLENQRVLRFEFQRQKLLRLYHNTYVSNKDLLKVVRNVGSIYDEILSDILLT